ncbi:MAG: peptide-methionine (R)-S-oxide reductase MsrB [Bryobacteraceae bacterium]|nr:peptide-methionine (R)-S-oxide reductase MsrB [Bryobacteraceae bacterium]
MKRRTLFALPMTAAALFGQKGEKKVKMVDIAFFNEAGVMTGVQKVEKVVKPDAEWKAQLTPEQYRIARNHGTEPAFCGRFDGFKGDGIFKCICCWTPLFDSRHKYESKSGWASWFQPIHGKNVKEKTDMSFGMVRTEVLCTRCDAHLGHVFDDGPRPTGLRYCINSEVLHFVERAS